MELMKFKAQELSCTELFQNPELNFVFFVKRVSKTAKA